MYTAVRDLTFTVARGEFCAIVGPTGSGKSTTLSLIAGLEPVSRGRVEVLGESVASATRHVGYMFQTDAVFPWKNVLGNVATGPIYRGVPRSAAQQRAKEWIARVGLVGFEDRYPHQGPLWQHISVTLEETILAFFIGVFLGVVAGFSLGRIRTLAVVFGPYVRMGNAIPRVILGSIFVIWLGLGMPSKVALGVTLTFFVVFFNAFQGVREVDPNLVHNARILGAGPWQLSFDVMLPAALTWITSSLHTSFGFALVGAVVGEFIGATQGLGYLVAVAQGAFNANGVLAALVILSAVALIADALVTWLERRLTPWRPAPALQGL